MDLKSISRAQFKFGYEVLGPIFYEFCNKLRLYRYAHESEDSITLYVARGGFRIKYLYDLFHKVNSLTPKNSDEALFYISRVAAVKCCLWRDYDYVSRILVKEFIGSSLAKSINYLLGSFEIPESFKDREINFSTFKDLYFINSLGDALQSSFQNQHALFDRYLTGVIKNKKTILLIDTGWTGNIQAMLMRCYPHLKWTGLYFGKWDYANCKPGHFSSVYGIAVSGNNYNPFIPSTAIFYYVHLIEALLEVDMPRTNAYVQSSDGEIIPNNFTSGLSLEPNQSESHLLGVVEYFTTFGGKKTPFEISSDANRAYWRLGLKINFPNKKDVTALYIKPRYIDCFEENKAHSIVDPNSMNVRYNTISRFKGALWKQGQIAIEFSLFRLFLLNVVFVVNIIKSFFFYLLKRAK